MHTSIHHFSLIICLIFFFNISLTGQSPNVEISNLRGNGEALVTVNKDGILTRTSNNNGLYYYSINPIDFKQTVIPIPIVGPSTIREYYAPVHVPDGTIIRNIGFWYKDRTPPNLIVELLRVELGMPTTLYTSIVMGTPDEPTLVEQEFLQSEVYLVDNQRFQYYMRIGTLDSSGILVDWPALITFYSAYIGYAY